MIAVLAAILLLAAGVLSLLQWVAPSVYSGRQVFLEDRGGRVPLTDDLRPRLPEKYEFADSWVTLHFILDDFDVSAGEFAARVSADLNVEKYKHRYPFDLLPHEIRLTLHGEFSDTLVTVPLSVETVDQPRATLKTKSFKLEAWGVDSAFPNDSYGSNNFLDIGPGMGYPSVTVLAGQRLAAYAMEVRVNETYLNVLLERSKTQIAWTYILASSPFVLLAVLMWLGLTRRSTAAPTALGVVVGLLALPPLRQVLVPQNVSDITRVDIVLGFEFIFFVAWLAVAVLFLDVWPDTHIQSGQSGRHAKGLPPRRPGASAPIASRALRRAPRSVRGRQTRGRHSDEPR